MFPQLYVWPRMSDTTSRSRSKKWWRWAWHPASCALRTLSLVHRVSTPYHGCTHHTHEELTIPRTTQSSSQGPFLSWKWHTWVSFFADSVTPSSSSALRTLSAVNGGSLTHWMRTRQELPPSLHGWLLKYWAIAVPITSSLHPGHNRRPSTAIQPCSQCRTECTSLSAGQAKTQRHSTINPQSKHGTHGFRGSTRERPF